MEPEVAVPCSQEPATGTPLSEISPVHTLPPYFRKIHLNVILPPTPSFPKWSFLSRFSDKTLHTVLMSPNAICRTQLRFLNLITNNTR
jgi:hypothetical protein